MCIFQVSILVINGVYSSKEYLCVLTTVGYDSYTNSLSKLLIRKNTLTAAGILTSLNSKLKILD